MGVHFSIAFLRQLLARLVPLPLVGGIRVPQTEAHHGTVVAVDVPHAMAPLDAAGCALIDDLADHPSVQDAVLGVAAVGIGHPDPQASLRSRLWLFIGSRYRSVQIQYLPAGKPIWTQAAVIVFPNHCCFSALDSTIDREENSNCQTWPLSHNTDSST